MSTSVEGIVNTLAEIETEIDRLSTKVEGLKKQMIANSEEQITYLRQKLTEMAKEEAEKIVNGAREEAENESAEILKNGDKYLEKIKKNIESSLGNCVELVLRYLFSQ
jgi:vacuolar-type H+-ATPase subunit H